MEYPSLGTPPAGSIDLIQIPLKWRYTMVKQWWNIDSTSPHEQTGGTRALFMLVVLLHLLLIFNI